MIPDNEQALELRERYRDRPLGRRVDEAGRLSWVEVEGLTLDESSIQIMRDHFVTGEMGELTRTGPCGATFRRWVTPDLADGDLPWSPLPAFPN
jgi:hypothetical protein